MIADIYIIKRNGKREPFSVDKIRNAISKAFISVGGFASQEAMTNILSRLNIYDGIAVEEIQNQVERSLMAERYYEVAKAYILYRQKHYEDREVKDKMEFLINYCNARNAATGSKYDANANVERKNIAPSSASCPSPASSVSTAACSATASRTYTAKNCQINTYIISTTTSSTRTTRPASPTIAPA